MSSNITFNIQRHPSIIILNYFSCINTNKFHSIFSNWMTNIKYFSVIISLNYLLNYSCITSKNFIPFLNYFNSAIDNNICPLLL